MSFFFSMKRVSRIASLKKGFSRNTKSLLLCESTLNKIIIQFQLDYYNYCSIIIVYTPFFYFYHYSIAIEDESPPKYCLYKLSTVVLVVSKLTTSGIP